MHGKYSTESCSLRATLMRENERVLEKEENECKDEQATSRKKKYLQGHLPPSKASTLEEELAALAENHSQDGSDDGRSSFPLQQRKRNKGRVH
jgi:hypothetical protein